MESARTGLAAVKFLWNSRSSLPVKREWLLALVQGPLYSAQEAERLGNSDFRMCDTYLIGKARKATLPYMTCNNNLIRKRRTSRIAQPRHNW